MLILACVTGKLDCSAKGLGPNDYKMINLATDDDGPDDLGDYSVGNAGVSVGLASMEGVLITLTPKDNNSKFTFSTGNGVAQAFFAGDFSRI